MNMHVDLPSASHFQRGWASNRNFSINNGSPRLKLYHSDMTCKYVEIKIGQ